MNIILTQPRELIQFSLLRILRNVGDKEKKNNRFSLSIFLIQKPFKVTPELTGVHGNEKTLQENGLVIAIMLTIIVNAVGTFNQVLSSVSYLSVVALVEDFLELDTLATSKP
jgi:hypothetical protein